MHKISAQAEFTTWGNMTGIRVDGQLMEFETSACVVSKDRSYVNKTEREKQPIFFSREKDKKIFEYLIDSVKAIHKLQAVGTGLATMEIDHTPLSSKNVGSLYFRIDLPKQYYNNANVSLAKDLKNSPLVIDVKNFTERFVPSITHIQVHSKERQLIVTLKDATDVIVRNESGAVQIYVKILESTGAKNVSGENTITFNATGTIAKNDVNLVVDASKQGSQFDGLGGNFRLQNEKTDPPVIDYCLNNLRVTWGRVEMPWRFWQAEEASDPIALAKSGKLHPRVQAAMEMAQRLYQSGSPIILSNWSAPDWAIEGTYTPRPVNGVWGNALNQNKADKIYASVAAYLLYLKDVYHVEVEAFSFNESDLGINVRQTPEEHRKLIKELGTYLASKGLKTKLLLGDTADVTGYDFTNSAVADTSTYGYICAVSFHSWRGYSNENLARWAAIAKQINKPLLVGEGSIDAGAWRYPAIFEEPTYALDEINLYVNILSVCQPLSILQWQLTADYSPLSGGGVFGNTETPLHPTQRFWNLKQLASTQPKIFALPITSNSKDVTCAALGDATKNEYTLHIVNNGAARNVTVSGLPVTIKSFHLYTTNTNQHNEEGKLVTVKNGKATFQIGAASFISLLSSKQQ